MSFAADVKEELLGLKMWDVNSSMKQEEQITRVSIREAFIKSGFINDPNKEYHLEILFKSKKKAEAMKQLLQNFDINAGITKKGSGYITYLKDGEDISSFLALIGANNGVLRFEEIRVLKDARNNVNRLVNCETANLNKTLGAANIQIENIKYLKKHKKFDVLPESLKEIAEIRLNNQDLSYEEIGKLLKDPISKSGVYHRLNKINQIVEELECTKK
jgi:DNA-binding protein WhiA